MRDLRNGDVVWCVKWFLCKPEDLSSDPQHVCKSQVWWCVSVILALGSVGGGTETSVPLKPNSYTA